MEAPVSSCAGRVPGGRRRHAFVLVDAGNVERPPPASPMRQRTALPALPSLLLASKVLVPLFDVATRTDRHITHGAGDASGFPFSTTYTPTSRVAVLPLLWASCTTPAGTTNDSPALIVRGDWPSTRSCTSPSMT